MVLVPPRSTLRELRDLVVDRSTDPVMAEIRRMPKSEFEPEDAQPIGDSPSIYSFEEGSRYCAYDLTRGRFLSTEIEAADFSPLVLQDRLPTLGPGSRGALWLSPYRGLSPTNFRFPIDLVMLDQRCAVLSVTESYPISLGSETGVPAASALILPAHTVASVGVRAGDQLILCTPEEMKGNLRSLMAAEPRPVVSSNAPDDPAGDSDIRTFRLRSLGNAVYWSDRTKTALPIDMAELEPVRPSEPTAPHDQERWAIAEQFGWNRPAPTPQKNWFQRWRSKKEPEDPRGGLRETLPGLVAHFFTGGRPAAHGIRNISTTGIYVLTEERWYLGTIIRMTLSDRLEKSFERSLTLNAKVVRWGNDGVGLQFMLRHKGDRVAAEEDISGGMTDELLEQFLRSYRDDHLAGQG